MKVFSYLQEKSKAELPGQITFEINRAELSELSSFLLQCLSEIEEDEDWEHEHFSDFLEKELDCDLVIYNSYKK